MPTEFGDTVWRPAAGSSASVRLRSGRWVGGLYVNAVPVRSYVGADGPVQDIYLAHAAVFDQDSGNPVRRGGYSPRPGVSPADVPKDLFRPKTTDELTSGSHR